MLFLVKTVVLSSPNSTLFEYLLTCRFPVRLTYNCVRLTDRSKHLTDRYSTVLPTHNDTVKRTRNELETVP